MFTKKMLVAVAAAAGVALVPAAARAESAAPTGDAADFLQGATCAPPDGAACFDAQAGGAKISGTLSVVYDKQPNDERCPLSTPGRAFVKDMHVNLTMMQGNVRVPFTTNYLGGPPAHASGFCLLTQRLEQVKVIIELVRRKVVPFFFNCDPDSDRSCPAFRIKSISNFQYTTGHPSLAPYPYSGGFSADIVIAAQ